MSARAARTGLILGGMEFFGRYIEVTPPTRIVWTNEENGESQSVTTVTFEESAGRTLLVMSEVYPTKEALDTAETGAQEAARETFTQLEELLATMEHNWAWDIAIRAGLSTPIMLAML